MINKAIKSNKSRAGIVLKKKIINDLINLGYESFLISNIINNFSFSSGNDILKKEYEKLYKKLSKKYSGSELKYKIKQKLYQKGFVYEGEELYKEE